MVLACLFSEERNCQECDHIILNMLSVKFQKTSHKVMILFSAILLSVNFVMVLISTMALGGL